MLQYLEPIGLAILVSVENCHAGGETDHELAPQEHEESPAEVNAEKDRRSLPVERGEDSSQFWGDHSAGTSDDSPDATSSVNPYLRDPVGWVTHTLGEFWWSGQHRMAQSVVENRYSAFKASHDVSKSHTMSRLALWWIDVHPPGEAFVVTTAPTTPQVEAILWRYMGIAHRKANLSGRITLDAEWYHRQRARRVRPQAC